MVFNIGRMSDAELIDKLGGPAKVAELLKYRKPAGTCRVHNWKTRGIPAAVKVRHPELFLPHLAPATSAPAASQANAAA